MLTSSQVESGVDDLYRMAMRKKREGGLGPLQRQYATRDRIRSCIESVEAEGAVEGVNGPATANLVYQKALERAKLREESGHHRAQDGYGIGILAMLLSLLLPVLEYFIKAWIAKRTGISLPADQG